MIHRKTILWQTMTGSLVLLGTVLGMSRAQAAPKPVPAKRCAAGRYVVKGRALLRAGVPDGADAVVLSIPGEADGTPPTLAVASGCPEAPVTLEAKKGGTRVSARLAGCSGVAGDLTFRGRIDASCRIMRGSLRARPAAKGRVRGQTAAKRIRVRQRFKAQLNGGFMGSVLGKVAARHGTASFPLRDMEVVLVKRTRKTLNVPAVQSDEGGRFTLVARTGEYDVCASGGGFPLTCNPEPVRFGPDLPDEDVLRDIEIPVDGNAVHGRVLLADGSPCYEAANPLDGGVVATVSRDGTSVAADTSASYLLPDLPGPGSYTLHATCGAAQVAQAVSVGAEELAGTRAVDLTMPNTPPQIAPLSASQGGHGVQRAAAGATVDVAADVIDPDGDALRYAWIDDNGGVTSVDAPKARWTMQSVPAQNTLNLLVTDGKGGYATQQLVLRAGVPFTRFSGTVKQPDGTPLANATVTVGGQATQTDDTGSFHLKVADAPGHVLSVKAPGHAPYSRPFDGDAAGLDITLGAARRFTVDAGAPIDIMDGPDGSTLHVPAGALVDAAGNPATGPLAVEVYTYDGSKGEFPGNGVGERDGQLEGMQLQTCLWLTVTDASGRRFNLAPGRHAELSFKMPATVLTDPPATIPFVRFDDATGRWVEDGIARLHGDRYVAEVTQLGSAGITFFNGGACLRIQVDDNSLERPFWLGITDPTNGSSGTIFVTEKLTPIYGLRKNTLHTLAVSPKSNPAHVTTTVTVQTAGNVSGPASPPFPYSTCKGVSLKAKLPSKSWMRRTGHGNEQLAQAYYQKIGAIPAKDTFAKWLAANGFESNPRSSDVAFFNPNEIGLGRRVNCRMPSQGIVACYNTKFGEVGGNVDEMLHDTADLIAPGDSVAMEFSPGGLKPERNVKYFIYGTDGKLKTKTAFDTEGYVKYVPHVCNSCHNGGFQYVPTENFARFVTLDPHEYKYPASGPYTLENQQERFRQLNEMISYALQHTGPAWKLMDSIYPASPGAPLGVHKPGTKARPAPVPEGWQSAPDIYTKIVKPSCRTCHMNQIRGGGSGPFDFDEAYDELLGVGVQHVCSGEMPDAMAPMLRLYKSAPFLPDVFSNFYYRKSCGGGPGNAHPSIAIILPTGSSQPNYGGKNGVHFSALASDPEDGTNISIKWIDETGAVIGTGPSFDKVYPAPGTQKVRAIVTDSFGNPATSSAVTFFVTNTTPTLTINKPFPGQKLVTDTSYLFEASTFDPNEPFLEVPCSGIEWRSSNPTDRSAIGCANVWQFSEHGTRTLTVTATDTQGASVTRTQTLNVEAKVQPPPPQVTIASPTAGLTFGVDESVPLVATVTDPAGGQPIAQWSVFLPDLTELPIGAGNTLSWTPASTLPPACHTYDVTLKAHVEAPKRGVDDAFTKITIKGPGCQTPNVIITSPMEHDQFFATEQVPLSAEVVDPTAPPPASDTPSAPPASDTPGGKLPVRWYVKNVDGDGTEAFLGEGNPLSWRPRDAGPGCQAGNYMVIARASNSAGETTAFRQVSIGDNANLCDN